MTSLERFSNLTHDELFENYGISEIKTYQNDLQKEVDKKKNEIRVMVGEKYRDFIEVADRIDCMNKLSANITNRIENISSSLTTLNLNLEDEQKFKCDLQTNQDKTAFARSTIAVLIKLLVDIEEQIWIEISENKFITATTLLQLAVHIKTALSLEASWQVDKRFPVVFELWNSILRFPLILTQMVEEKIKVTDLSIADACECLCTLTILENLNCVEVIRRFISLRTETLKTILNVENVTQNVKTNVIGSFQIIINTFEVLYRCFTKLCLGICEDNQGQYWVHMQNMTAPLCKPAIGKVKLDFTTKFGKIYVPSSVQNFKVKSNKPVDFVESKKYNQYVDDWLLWIKDYVKPQVVILLNIINSLKTLQVLKESIPALPHDWLSILDHFSQHEDSNLWNEIYLPLITERAKAVLLDQWNLVFKRIHSELEVSMSDILNDRAKEPEHDLHWFLWNSFEEDLAEKISLDSYRSVQSLSIKSAGQSPNSGKICIFIQSLVSDMMKEISDICSDSNPETEESQVLKRHQQQCCIELIERLIVKVTDLSSQEDILENAIIFLARILSGVATLCSSVKQCVLLMDDKGEKWQGISTKLQEESLNIWRKWSAIAPRSILSEYKICITSSSVSSLRIKHFPRWETIKIKEENEAGEEVDTEILVPFQASFPLQRLLNSLTSLCSRTLPPRIIVVEMIENVIVDIVSSLGGIDEETSHQAVNIQYLFDLKYLSELLIPSEKNNLISSSNETIGKFESKIDPVDLDTLSSHISQNVQQHVYRTQGLYGLLINIKSKVTCEQYNDNSEDPSVTYVGTTNVPWFPLLPSTGFPATKAEDIFKS